MNEEPITLTRGECLAIALLISTHPKNGAPEFEAALSSVQEKLAPLTGQMWDRAFADLAAKP